MPTIEVNTEQLKSAIRRLPQKDKVRIVEELQRDTWQERFKNLLCRIDKRLKSHPLSEEEITREVEKARKEYYDRSRNRQ